MSHTRSRTIRLAAVAAVVGGLSLFSGGAALADTGDQDAAYVVSNGQTNLAEITIGQLALDRSSDDDVLMLAKMTYDDHTAALAKLTDLAEAQGYDLPDAPSPKQQADAAALKAADDGEFDLLYAQVQVAGHQLSIANTEAEIANGSDPEVVAYAQWYLPVAQHHLEMALDTLVSLGGSPSSVPAGSAGLAAPTSEGTLALEVGVGVLGAALVAGGGVLLARRRRVTSGV
jgi:putative membrane protein